MLTPDAECAEGPEESADDEEYRPDKCLVQADSDFVGGQSTVGVVTMGGQEDWIVEQHSDGTYSLTYVENLNAAASTGVGGGVNFGFGQAGAEGSIGVEGGFKSGSTWNFDSKEELDEFRDDVEELKNYESKANGTQGGVGSVMFEDPPEVRDPDVVRDERGGGISAGAQIFAGAGSTSGEKWTDRGNVRRGTRKTPEGEEEEMDWSTSLRLEQKGAVKVSATPYNRERDTDAGTTAYSYEIEGSASVNKDKWARKGSLKVVEDTKTGEIVGLEMVQTSESPGGEREVVTTKLDIETDEERRIAEDWIGIGEDQRAIGLTFDSMAPETLPEDANEFERLVFESGTSHTTTYDSSTDKKKLGANIKLGLGLGIGVNWGDTTSQVQESEYLGAPSNGRREYVDFTECVKE